MYYNYKPNQASNFAQDLCHLLYFVCVMYCVIRITNAKLPTKLDCRLLELQVDLSESASCWSSNHFENVRFSFQYQQVMHLSMSCPRGTSGTQGLLTIFFYVKGTHTLAWSQIAPMKKNTANGSVAHRLVKEALNF